MAKLVLSIAMAITLPACLLTLGVQDTLAQSRPDTGSGQALEIAPPVISLSANPGETVKAQINLRNISSSNLIVNGQVNDFTAAGEDGVPKILLESDEQNPYSLRTWVSPLPTLTTIPRQIKILPVTISVPRNAAPGGYYGVIRFTATPPELEGTGVSLSASLGSLVLLSVKGNVKQSLAVEEFSVNKSGKTEPVFESAPLDFAVRLKNNGNIHEVPVGNATITDMFGKKLAVLNFNQPPRNILPRSIRKFTHPLDSSVIGNKILFGRYTANLRMTYGSDKKEVTSSLTFWVIPYRFIGIVITLLVVGFFVLRFLIGRYNRRIIQKAQKKTRHKK